MLLNLFKKCSKCSKSKSVDDFYYISTKSGRIRQYYSSYCKECIKVINKRYRNSEGSILNRKRYYEVLKKNGKMREYNKIASLKRKERMRLDPEYAKRFRDKDRSYRKLEKYVKKRRIANLKRLENKDFRLHNNISRLVRYHLKDSKNNTGIEKILGYSINELKRHLESQFDKNMSWKNYGTYWHIDHILPRSWPNSTFEKIWSLSNLRPLEARANIRKGSSWEYSDGVFISCRK